MAGKTVTTAEKIRKYHLTVLWHAHSLAYDRIMADGSGIAKLTEREKESLRGRLGHKTAKEIALELGVSHHAVEKRLKMARTKLGVSSSLEAARALARVEGYHPMGSHAPDIVPTTTGTRMRPTRPQIMGATIVSLLLAATLAFAFVPNQADPAVSVPATRLEHNVPDDRYRALPNGHRAVSMCEANVLLNSSFQALDADHSGFMEPAEAVHLEPVGAQRDAALPPVPGEGHPDSPAMAKWMNLLDRDRDGLIAQGEYVVYMTPYIQLSGVPEGWADPGLARCRD